MILTRVIRMIAVAGCLLAATVGGSQVVSTNVEERIQKILAQMSLEEKVSLLAGKDGGETKTIARLGIPPLKVIDGPAGIGWGTKAVCFPCGAALGATWNPSVVEEVGKALGRETRAAGRHVLLAPCVNIHRTPLAGRNFETFSEDPYLTGILGVAYVRGIQSEGIGTSLKHYACNNQEWERGSINVEVDERALREIYLPHFERVVREADPWTVMAAYNKVRKEHCTANRCLLTDILKKEWNYQGVVVSDWGAVHGTVDCALAGLDLEMPGPGQFFAQPLMDAVHNGEVPEEVINDKVMRILRLLARAGLLDEKPPARAVEELNSPKNRDAARVAALEAPVLLKNAGSVLPLDPARMKRLAVIGPNADAFRTGGGSANVEPATFITPLQGLKEYAAGRFEMRYLQGCALAPMIEPIPSAMLRPPPGKGEEHGLLAEYFANTKLSGNPVVTRVDPNINFEWKRNAPAPGIPTDGFSVRWTGTFTPTVSGEYELGMTSDDGFRLYLDGKLLLDFWADQWAVTRTARVQLAAGKPYSVRIEYFENQGDAVAKFGWCRSDKQSIREAADLAKSCDAAILFVGLSGQFDTEGTDRADMELPGHQNELIRVVAAANPRTIVVMIAGSPLNMESWIENVPVVLWAWYLGQEAGAVLPRLLFGEVSPSGKLPVSLPKRLEDNPSHGHYPGSNGTVRYAEGIYVGYRHYDTRDVEPRFPFGHGLSYTTFAYSDFVARISTHDSGSLVQVSFQLKNTGRRPGAETAQLYVRDVQSRVDRPRKELKAFKKVLLQPGETATIAMDLGPDAFSYWDPEQARWVLEPGEFEILVGSSSRDIRLRKTIRL
jgi:beta-glucosidase